MKFLRHLAWPLAMLPVLAAFVWTSFAARLPEPAAARRALGEATMRWEFAALTDLRDEPAHLVARALHLAVLHVPGSSLWWAASVLAVLAVLLAFAVLAVARRSFALDGAAQPFVLGCAGLLVASPAFGADWLHSERIGLVLVPLLLLWATILLAGAGAFAWRTLLVLLLVVAAPLCHTNGLLVFAAVAPMLLDAARRAGSTHRLGWLLLLLIVGNLAAVYAMVPAGGIALADGGLLGSLAADPVAAARQLLCATGTAWLDPVPTAHWDELLLGSLSWTLPLVCWRLGDRSDAARQRAAPWWGCLWFGLSLFVLAAERHGTQLAVGPLRELTYGAFLLPLGCIGVLAARFGAGFAPVGAGMLLVLAAQDWPRGVEELRRARLQVERTELQLHLGSQPVSDELRELQANGWAAAVDPRFAEVLRAAATAPRAEKLGGVLGGTTTSVHGLVRSSLAGDNVLCVVAMADDGTGAVSELGRAVPDPGHRDRDVPWAIEWKPPLAEGARVLVVGYRLRSGTLVALAPSLVVHDGTLVPGNGG